MNNEKNVVGFDSIFLGTRSNILSGAKWKSITISTIKNAEK